MPRVDAAIDHKRAGGNFWGYEMVYVILVIVVMTGNIWQTS